LESFGFELFVGDVINRGMFRSFWFRLPDPGPQPPRGNSLFLSMDEPKRHSASLEPLIGLLAFVVG